MGFWQRERAKQNTRITSFQKRPYINVFRKDWLGRLEFVYRFIIGESIVFVSGLSYRSRVKMECEGI